MLAVLPFLGEGAVAVGEFALGNALRGSAMEWLMANFGRQAVMNTVRAGATQIAETAIATATAENVALGAGAIGTGLAGSEIMTSLAGAEATALTTGAEAFGGMASTETLLGSLATNAVEGGLVESGVGSTLLDGAGAGILTETEAVAGSTMTSSAGGIITEIAEESILGGTSLVIPEELTIAQRLEYALADIGVSKEALGETAWNFWLGAVGIGGVYTVEEVVDLFKDGSQPDAVNTVVDSITKGKDGIYSTKEFVIIDSNGVILDPNNSKISSYSVVDSFALGVYTGKQVAGIAMNMRYRPSKSPNQRTNFLVASMKSAYENQESAVISKKLVSYLLSTEYLENPDANLEQYNLIKKIYTSEFKSEPYWKEENGQRYVAMLDENGAEVVYRDSKGVVNIAGYEFKNPNVFGEFVGPASSNSDLPISVIDPATGKKRFSLLDEVAMQHDTGYSETFYFSEIEDQKLVARLENAFERNHQWISAREKYTASFALNWFKYVSPMLSKLTNQQLSTERMVSIFNSGDNFYSYLLMKYRPEVNNKSQFGFSAPVYRARAIIRHHGEAEFWSGVSYGLNESFKYYYELYKDEEFKITFDNLPIVSVS